MSQPHITAICLTYGRPQHLEEAITCFLAQDYTGPKELLILNSFPRQTLICEAPNVRIINLPERPPSLGDARNLAIENSAGTHLITFDDDDLYLPHHLSLMAEHFAGNDWIWFSRQFYAENDRIKSVVGGSANVVAFTKAAWEAVGRYRPMGTGEDRDFVGRLTSSRPGQRVDIAADRCSFVYCWANGVHHISGLGDDPPGRLSSYQRAHLALERLVRQRKVPVGEIRLKPRPRNKCVGMAQQFLAKLGGGAVVAAPVDTQSVGIVQLGRYGDIINILPICRHIAKVYRKPHLICGREFAQLLDGVSYVEPFPVDLGHGQLREALDIAKRHFSHVITAQIWGIGCQQDRLCDSFNREAWRKAGFLSRFPDPSWRVVFDRRNRAREEALANKLNVNGRPMLLVCLSGISSPFGSGPGLLKAIQARFSAHFQIIDLSNVRAERIFDVLGLMDRAAGLVTVDSSMLHLAAGSAVPVVALVNPAPWLGSAPRAKCVARITYVEADRDPAMVISAIAGAVALKPEALGPVDPLPEAIPAPRIFHVVARHDDRSGRVRKQKAHRSWAELYKKGVIPRHLMEPYPRNSSSTLGDRRALPFLKDVLAHGMAEAGDNDIIMLTNDDNGLDPRLPELLRFQVGVYGACCSFRVDSKVMPKRFMMGRDMFAFTKKWLARNWDRIPDFLLGSPEWDWALAGLIRLDHGIQSTRKNIEEEIFPAEIPAGYVTHESHTPKWSFDAKSTGLQHNKRLFAELIARHLPDFFQTSESPGKRLTLSVRRSGSIGDALAASFIATKLLAAGHDVTFQCDPSLHPIFQHHPTLSNRIAAPNGKVNIDLDNAYEKHPERTRLHFAQMFASVSESQSGLRVSPTNFAPRLNRAVPHNAKPRVLICPRSNSWVNRQIPDPFWLALSGIIQGDVFWLGTHPAPSGIADLKCRTIAEMVEHLKQADLLVSVDTGPMHVAAALGVPIVAIEQASSPELHLSDQRDFVTVHNPLLDCLNCQQNICPKDAQNPPCQLIDVGQVASEVNRKLRQYQETISCTIAVYKPPIERLNKCLAHVLPQVSEVIIAGDMETPWPLSGLIADPKIICVRKNAVKTGYGKKQNFAMRHSSGKFVLQLNDDCYLEPNVVSVLRSLMEGAVGMVSHLLRYPNGTIQYAGKFRPPGAIGFGHLDHKKRASRIKEPVEQESICGASILVRRDAFFQVDGFDEDYYLYADDDDLALKFRAAGYRLIYTPHAVGIHEEHCSSSITPEWRKILQQSEAHFANKWKNQKL